MILVIAKYGFGMSSINTTMDYAFESRADNLGVDFAASTKPNQGNSFFQAKLRQPRLVGQMLTSLQRVVQAQFYTHKPPMRDPVVTSHQKLLRWEGFSGCCGIYGRVDLDERAFSELEQSFGTTNVDFNSNIVSHLARLGSLSDAHLRVTREAVELQTEHGKSIEKKVELPERWIRGFGEVQVYQARLVPICTISPMTMSKLFQTIKATGFGVQHFELQGPILKPVFMPSPKSIPIAGLERLKLIHPLLSVTDKVHAWRDSEETDVSAWQLETKVGSFWLVLSPGLERGFSGEGQANELLAASDWKEHLDRVLAWLGERGTLDPAEGATQLGLRVADLTSVFAALAVSGLAGFDAASGYYFQRKLPFLVNQIEQFQPRYRNAQRILDQTRVQILSRVALERGEAVHCSVIGDHCEYHVNLIPDRETCTCTWYNRYQGTRGSCKHVLAAKLFVRSKNETVID